MLNECNESEASNLSIQGLVKASIIRLLQFAHDAEVESGGQSVYLCRDGSIRRSSDLQILAQSASWQIDDLPVSLSLDSKHETVTAIRTSKVLALRLRSFVSSLLEKEFQDVQ